MQRQIANTLAAVLLLCLNAAGANQDPAKIVFTENKGQVHDQHHAARPDVLFSGNAGALTYHLKKDGISWQLYSEPKNDRRDVYRIDLSWKNAQAPEIISAGISQDVSNYYFESCPNGALGVHDYTTVTLQGIYPGVDVKFYSHDGQFKYDYIVNAGGRYQDIRIDVKGSRKISVNGRGELIIETPFGIINEGLPLVFQKKKQLTSRWITEGSIVSFAIENAEPGVPLVIDPVVRVWGTYFGGLNGDYPRTTRTDSAGNVYISGFTKSGDANMVATSGSHQSTLAGNEDAFLAKFNAAGARLWATYYGTSQNEEASGMTVHGSNVYIAGFTTSFTSSVLATAGSHQQNLGGGNDAFIAKFNSNGVRQWASYYGGTGNDLGNAVATDQAGNVYMCGHSNSAGTAIASGNAYQPANNGNNDAYIVKFNASGTRQWGTFFGGPQADYPFDIATDSGGNVYISGQTNSPSGLAAAGAHQPALNGNNDLFLAKFNTSGTKQWCTYYGGSMDESYGYCTVDKTDNVYLAGITASSESSLVTGSAHQNLKNGATDCIIAKFNGNGSRLWGTFYGGIGLEYLFDIHTDKNRTVYVCGASGSSGTLFGTAGSHQPAIGGNTDAFLSAFDSLGTRAWSTYYGGKDEEFGYSVAGDNASAVYMTGITAHSDPDNVIATNGSHQSASYASVATPDGFLVKFSACSPLGLLANSNAPVCERSKLVLNASAGGNASQFMWKGPQSYSTALATDTIFQAQVGHSGIYTITAADAGCIESKTIAVNIVPGPTVNIVNNAATVCAGQAVNLSANGAQTYTWSNGANNHSISVSPSASTVYLVTGTGTNSCKHSAQAIVAVDACTSMISSKTEAIALFPNPVSDVLNIVSPGGDKIRIYNTLGQLVHDSFSNSAVTRADVSALPRGAYIVTIEDKGELRTMKFVKQ